MHIIESPKYANAHLYHRLSVFQLPRPWAPAGRPRGSGVSAAGTWRSAGEISAEFCAENSAEICAEILLVVPSVEVEIHMFSRWVDGIVDSALDSGVVG